MGIKKAAPAGKPSAYKFGSLPIPESARHLADQMVEVVKQGRSQTGTQEAAANDQRWACYFPSAISLGWTPEDVHNNTNGALNYLDRANRLFAIAARLAEGNPGLCELLLHASAELRAGMDTLQMIHGFNFDLEVDV
ncbi:hypothetical protein [Geothrix sp.]|jgi:hypothetical protein|uniref:hypothetical protein n=1 Tax=Geothrix sp. TaxID=1962974 RepID=UPI0025C183B5|nr:hypothetical protein [Geothrix sp.]